MPRDLSWRAALRAPLFLCLLVAATVLGLCAPGQANATAKVRIEWITAATPFNQNNRGSVVNSPTAFYGAAQTLTVTGSTPQTTSAAPTFGNYPTGLARVTVVSGAVVASWGTSPTAGETNGVRLEAGQQPLLVEVTAGQVVTVVEAADGPVTPPTSSGGATAANQTSQITQETTTATNTGATATSAATIATNTTGVATAANQTAPQANAGSDASKAVAVQGVTGAKAVGVSDSTLETSAATIATNTTRPVYTLLSNASATGSATSGIAGGNYVLNVAGTFGGTTVSISQTVDGATTTAYTTTAVPTTAPCFAIGQGTVAQAVVTGGAPSGLYASLRPVDFCPLGGAITNTYFGARPQDASGTAFFTSGNPGYVSLAGSSGGVLGSVNIQCLPASSLPTLVAGTYAPPNCGLTGSLDVTIFGKDGNSGVGTASSADASTNSITSLATQGRNMLFNNNGTSTVQWDRQRSIQGADGTGIGVTAVATAPTSLAGAGIAPLANSAVSASKVVKSSAGNLYRLNVTSGGTAGYVLIFDASSTPSDGAVTPVKCFTLAANTSGEWTWSMPLVFSTGIDIVYSSTGCYSKTGSATAFISAESK